MEPGAVARVQYLAPTNPTHYHPAHVSATQYNIPAFHFTGLFGPTPHFQIPPPGHEFTSVGNSSASDEAEDQQQSVIDERKHRRMISNRESARRSRMRKQRHLDELWSRVVQLRSDNHQLIDKLNHVLASHDCILQENARLRKEASYLRQTLKELHLDIPYDILSDLDEVLCNTAHQREEPTD